MNQNQGSATKRAPRQFTRNNKASGDLVTWGLADMQPKKRAVRFRCTPLKVHTHIWLFGTDNAVCTECGLTIPKAQAQQQAQTQEQIVAQTQL